MSRPQPGFAAVDPPDRWTPTRGRFRPERLEAPIDSLHRRRADPEEAAREARPRARRRPARPPPAPLRAAAPEKRIAELFGDEEVLIEGDVLQDIASPRARPAPDPHRADLRRQRADLGDLVQPAVAEGQADAGDARAPARPAEPLRLRGPLVRPERRLGDRGLRAGLPGQRGGLGSEAARARRVGAAARDRPARPAAGLAEGGARAAAPRRRARCAAPAALARRGRVRHGDGSRSTSCSSLQLALARRAAEREEQVAAALPRARASWSSATAPRCRSS